MSLEDIPIGCFIQIAQHLPFNALSKVAQVNKKFYELIQSSECWLAWLKYNHGISISRDLRKQIRNNFENLQMTNKLSYCTQIRTVPVSVGPKSEYREIMSLQQVDFDSPVQESWLVYIDCNAIGIPHSIYDERPPVEIHAVAITSEPVKDNHISFLCCFTVHPIASGKTPSDEFRQRIPIVKDSTGNTCAKFTCTFRDYTKDNRFICINANCLDAKEKRIKYVLHFSVKFLAIPGLEERSHLSASGV